MRQLRHCPGTWLLAAALVVAPVATLAQHPPGFGASAIPDDSSYTPRSQKDFDQQRLSQSHQDAVKAWRSGDFSHALGIWMPLAQSGQAWAQVSIGQAYREGKGVVRNYDEAVRWTREAAKQGLPVALVQLGRMYQEGQGIPRNDQVAATLFRQAASAQSMLGHFYLALAHEHGRGVPKDLGEAIRLYRVAAQAGDEQARQALLRLETSTSASSARGQAVPEPAVANVGRPENQPMVHVTSSSVANVLESPSSFGQIPSEISRLVDAYPTLKAAPIPAFVRLHRLGLTSLIDAKDAHPSAYGVTSLATHVEAADKGLATARTRLFLTNELVAMGGTPNATFIDLEGDGESVSTFALGGLLILGSSYRYSDRKRTSSSMSNRNVIDVITDVGGHLFPIAKGNRLSLRLKQTIYPASSSAFSTESEVEFVVADVYPSIGLDGVHVDGGVAKVNEVVRTKFATFSTERRATHYYSEKYRWVIATDSSIASHLNTTIDKTLPVLIFGGHPDESLVQKLTVHDEELAAIHRKTVEQYITPNRPALLALLPGGQRGAAISPSSGSSLIETFGRVTGLLGAYAGILRRDTNLTNQGLELFARSSGLPAAPAQVPSLQVPAQGATSGAAAGQPKPSVQSLGQPGHGSTTASSNPTSKPGPYHPNAAYEYRVLNGRLVPPYTTRPAYGDNGWTCGDGNVDINCASFKEEQIGRAQLIYRRKR